MTAASNAPKAPGIAAEVRAAIRAGEYRVGHQLPSARALANRYGASRGTITVAMNALIREGLVESRPRTGWFVADAGAEVQRASVEPPRYIDRISTRPAAAAEAVQLGVEVGTPLLQVTRTVNDVTGTEQPYEQLLFGPDRTLVYELSAVSHAGS